MHVINLVTQRKDESRGKKKVTRHTQVSKPSHLSEIFPERTYSLSWSNWKKKGEKKAGDRRQGEKWFQNVPSSPVVWSQNKTGGEIIYKISFIGLHVLEMCLDTVLHALTYSTFYVENFNCTSFLSEGIHHSMRSCMKLHEKQNQILPNNNKKKPLRKIARLLILKIWKAQLSKTRRRIQTLQNLFTHSSTFSSDSSASRYMWASTSRRAQRSGTPRLRSSYR